MFRDSSQKTNPVERHIPVCINTWVPPGTQRTLKGMSRTPPYSTGSSLSLIYPKRGDTDPTPSFPSRCANYWPTLPQRVTDPTHPTLKRVSLSPPYPNGVSLYPSSANWRHPMPKGSLTLTYPKGGATDPHPTLVGVQIDPTVPHRTQSGITDPTLL